MSLKILVFRIFIFNLVNDLAPKTTLVNLCLTGVLRKMILEPILNNPIKV